MDVLKGFFAGTALVLAGSVQSIAAPVAAPMTTQSPIVLASGGCGFAYHRNPFGVCVPNRAMFYGPGPIGPVRLPPPCPPGYHRDRNPARPICYPNF